MVVFLVFIFQKVVNSLHAMPDLIDMLCLNNLYPAPDRRPDRAPFLSQTICADHWEQSLMPGSDIEQLIHTPASALSRSHNRRGNNSLSSSRQVRGHSCIRKTDTRIL